MILPERELHHSLSVVIDAVGCLPWSLFPNSLDNWPMTEGENPHAIAARRVLDDLKKARAVERAARPHVRTAERAMQAYLKPHAIQWNPLGNRLTWQLGIPCPQIELSGLVRIRTTGDYPWPRHDIVFSVPLACSLRSLGAAQRLRAAAEALSAPEPAI